MDNQQPPATGSGSGSAVPESLDAVRDILFGAQMRSVDSRLQGMEERLLQELGQLRADTNRKVEDLEKRILRLQDTSNMADAELRDQLLMHSSAISAEFARTKEAFTTDLAGKHKELMTKKTDRVALARLLAQVARELGDSGSAADTDLQG